MKKSTQIVLIAAAFIVVSVLVYGFAFGGFLSPHTELGEQYAEAQDSVAASQVLASYNGEEITQADVDFKKSSEDTRSDEEITAQLLTGLLLVEEAESLNLAATAEEIQESLDLLQQNYAEYEESAKATDEYCQAAGITLDEYWTLVADELYSTISRFNLKTDFTEEYCRTHGYSSDALTSAQQAETEAAFEAHRAEILESHQAEIVYSDEPLTAR